ncbi:MAG TPA: DEAD/DEAH box helicase [Planctomicrobium sp.]|nr:DEAD/DEAH box helicase [Planctomicrobium sp.]
MSRQISLTPQGHLKISEETGPELGLDGDAEKQLDAAFSESSAEGLLRLASVAAKDSLPPTLMFWRQFSLRYLQAVCSMGESVEQRWNEIVPPDETELNELVAASPPMRGLEYLTPETLQGLWNELHALTQAQAKQFPDGTIPYLRQLNPAWQLLGRVNFHLAENKRDDRRPFAFLATYTHRLAAGSRMKHLPLAEALKEYAGSKNLSQLNALLEPVRRAASGSPLVQELLETKALFQPQVWNISQAHRFLVEVPRMEAAGLIVRVPDWWNPRRPSRPQVQVRLGGKRDSEMGATSLLDFEVDLAIDGDPLTDAERRRLLQANEGLILLRGRWVEVDQEKLQQALSHWERLQSEHPDGLSFIQGMRSLAGAQLEAPEEADQVADWSQVVAGDWLRETLQTLRDPRGMTLIQPGNGLNATLRPYQDEGVRWLWFMLKLGLGACLADDMGLGKTIQIIALLLQLKQEEKQEAESPASGKGARQKPGARDPEPQTAPSLLIVPSSLVGNWKQELEKFGPQLRVCYAHRSECDPETLKQMAENPQEALSGFDLLVTTYGLARRSDWLANVDWRLLILDEAQAIKNATAAQTKAVKKLSSTGRVVLTGTPVENHLGDLWSLFEFCCPGLLGSAAQFKKYVKRLNQQQDKSGFSSLRRLVRPYILRRLKTDPNVVPDLPDKTEMRVECGLSKLQAALYEKAVKDLKKRLEDADGIARRGLVLSTLMQLKQICNHPSQYLGDSTYAPKESGKFGRLTQICEPILERQEKMLVFTQFQSVCEPLAKYLASVFGRPGLVLHGKTPVKRRTELVREFQADGGPPFFVISVKAGGSGLNLTAASHVVHFDRWWNPAVENQATDRAFRIGQKRNVLVHKFLCRGTLEERIDQMIQSKRALSENLLDQSGETLLTELNDDELLRFVSIDIERAMAEE